ncbi:MAG TPA: DUF6183 family protein [Acidimicrobiales bacterium]|nr:DUF6183 family protein [Acidimicrobiales bacterium]
MSYREELVDKGDLDELTRFVERLTEQADWEELVWVRDDCRAAAARGKQLWPVTAFVNYALALEGPGDVAARAIEDAAGPGAAAARFGLGPLTEVAASTHAWDEVGPYLAGVGPVAGVFAQECVVRGADLTEAAADEPSIYDVPLVLAKWEPPYEVATYKLDKAEFPAPDRPGKKAWSTVSLPGAEFEADDDTEEGRSALIDLVVHWANESNGRVDATGVVGDVAGALRSLGLTTARVAAIAPEDAFAHMAWAAASGGAHGRRRGAAAGRFGAWWAAAAVVDLTHDWPLTAEELGDAVDEMRWYLWDEGHDPVGWSLRLAVEDPEHGLAWAVVASDAD